MQIFSNIKIFPDKNDNFKSIIIYVLIYIPEILIIYDNALKRIKEKDYDKRSALLSKEIEEYKTYKKLIQKKLYQILKLYLIQLTKSKK